MCVNGVIVDELEKLKLRGLVGLWSLEGDS
jgi:hypothetical protein